MGGWLVLEPWITPSLFEGTSAQDEYTFCLNADTSARQKLRQHRDMFITEADFAWLKAQGIDAVRLPVGYWVFGDQKPYLQTVQYVDKVFAWAKRHNLKVLLDLHGAPGSQNGEMHSGRAGNIGWPTQKQYQRLTLQVLTRLAERYGKRPELLGISFINEPAPTIPVEAMETFYGRAYQKLKPLIADGVWLIFSDTFRPRRWYHRLAKEQYPGLFVEHHQYQLFGKVDGWLPARLQLWRARQLLPGKIRRMTKYHPVIVGEWSAALRTEKLSDLQEAQRRLLIKQYGYAQLDAFESTKAWFYWTYKTESPNAWSLRDGIVNGSISLD